jgi:hypothetical protein
VEKKPKKEEKKHKHKRGELDENDDALGADHCFTVASYISKYRCATNSFFFSPSSNLPTALLTRETFSWQNISKASAKYQ